MIIVQLQAIKFRSRPDVQTVTYARRVPEWMTQWTVAANYAPALSEGRDISAIEEQFADSFWRDMNNAVPELCKRDKLDILEDFEFKYVLYEAQPGQIARFAGSGSFLGNDAFVAGDEKERAEQYTKMRPRLVDAMQAALPDDCLSLVDRYRETWSPDMIFDELGEEGSASRQQLGLELEKAFGAFYPKLYSLALDQAMTFLYNVGVRV